MIIIIIIIVIIVIGSGARETATICFYMHIVKPFAGQYDSHC